MTEQGPSENTPSTNSPTLIWVGGAVIVLIIGVVFFSLNQAPQPAPQPAEVVKIKPEPAKLPAAPKPPEVKPKPVKITKKPPAVTKPQPEPESKPTPKPPVFRSFTIEGNLSTGAEPLAIQNIVIKILWIKSQQADFKLGLEKAWLTPRETGLSYRLRLRTQSSQFTNWNNGVEGNIGRVIAFLDLEKDGKLSIQKDKIIAVSKELIRYRTGRFDSKTLSEAQQENIRKEGMGYVVVKQVELENEKLDWQVAYRDSPAPVNLSATDTRLPAFYTTMIKMQEK